MPKLSKRECLLLGMLATCAFFLWLGHSNGPERPEEPGVMGPDAFRLGAPPVVRMDLLELGTAGLDPRGRDLFTYHRIPEPTPPRGSSETTPTTEVSAETRPIDTDSSPPTLRRKLPRPAFSYIGLIGPRDGLIAVFDRGKGVFVAQLGEIIDDSFELLEFRHEAVILGCVDERFKGETVRLTKRSS